MGNKRDTVNRRELLRLGLLSPLITGIAADCEIDKDLSGPQDTGTSIALSDYPSLAATGGAVLVTLDGINGGKSIVIIRTAETSFSVLNAICTHQGCPVNLPAPQDTELHCPCHASVFSIETGAVKSGPAPAPLTVFGTSFNSGSGILTIYG